MASVIRGLNGISEVHFWAATSFQPEGFSVDNQKTKQSIEIKEKLSCFGVILKLSTLFSDLIWKAEKEK